MQQKYLQNIQDAGGALDGVTLFRFSHMSRSANAGGVETYLWALNGRLLERNRMRILQMYLAPESETQNVEIEKIGRGEIVWIPSIYKWNPLPRETSAQKLWAKVRRRFIPEFEVNHDLLLTILEKHCPNLAVFHWLSEDSKIVVNYVNQRNIPFVVINHFHNVRLLQRLIKQQISRAAAIGGVSNVDVPEFVRNRYTNLSDGLDTEFYRLENSSSFGMAVDGPIVLMPARVEKSKGHADAVQALIMLKRMGMKANMIFAGRVESADLVRNLREISSNESIENRVIFTGQLSSDELRKWYAACDVVMLSSHSEGLPRTLLEAQSMAKPVVAYNVGGVAEAFQNEVSGYLVKKGDIEGLARRLKELLVDQEKRSKMGALGRKFVLERYSIKSLVARHEKVYAEVMTKGTLKDVNNS